MYLPNEMLDSFACLAKYGMLLIQERFHFFMRGISSQLAHVILYKNAKLARNFV